MLRSVSGQKMLVHNHNNPKKFSWTKATVKQRHALWDTEIKHHHRPHEK